MYVFVYMCIYTCVCVCVCVCLKYFLFTTIEVKPMITLLLRTLEMWKVSIIRVKCYPTNTLYYTDLKNVCMWTKLIHLVIYIVNTYISYETNIMKNEWIFLMKRTIKHRIFLNYLISDCSVPPLELSSQTPDWKSNCQPNSPLHIYSWGQKNLQNVNYFTKTRGIIQNACDFFFFLSTDLNKIFHIRYWHIVLKRK